MVIKACLFDVFGTVVNWRKTLPEYIKKQEKSKNIPIPLVDFCNEWRSCYHRYCRAHVPGTPSNVDQAHRDGLEALNIKYNVGWTKEELDEITLIWHYLTPWPDSVPGIRALKKIVAVAPLSNGDFRLLLDMAKAEDLDWDFIFSGDLFLDYKPNFAQYARAVEVLKYKPEEVCMCAAHLHDLKGAQAVGLKTAYLRRVLEDDQTTDEQVAEVADIRANGLVDLADQISKLNAAEEAKAK